MPDSREKLVAWLKRHASLDDGFLVNSNYAHADAISLGDLRAMLAEPDLDAIDPDRGYEGLASAIERVPRERIREMLADLTPKPDAPPVPLCAADRVREDMYALIDRCHIEDLEGALRRANDRLAAIHYTHIQGTILGLSANVRSRLLSDLFNTLPTLIEEGEKALRGEPTC